MPTNKEQIVFTTDFVIKAGNLTASNMDIKNRRSKSLRYGRHLDYKFVLFFCTLAIISSYQVLDQTQSPVNSLFVIHEYFTWPGKSVLLCISIGK